VKSVQKIELGKQIAQEPIFPTNATILVRHVDKIHENESGKIGTHLFSDSEHQTREDCANNIKLSKQIAREPKCRQISPYKMWC